jgi:hypothetical protein
MLSILTLIKVFASLLPRPRLLPPENAKYYQHARNFVNFVSICYINIC